MGRSWIAGACIALVGLLAGAEPAAASDRVIAAVGVERVIDGDTFVITGGERIRIRNFDTPELRTYECREEFLLARAARAAAQDILDGRAVTLYVTGADRYDRIVADVVVLGRAGEPARDFVDAMVAGGHGARWAYGYEPQPQWCPIPGADWAQDWAEAALAWLAAWVVTQLPGASLR